MVANCRSCNHTIGPAGIERFSCIRTAYLQVDSNLVIFTHHCYVASIPNKINTLQHRTEQLYGTSSHQISCIICNVVLWYGYTYRRDQCSIQLRVKKCMAVAVYGAPNSPRLFGPQIEIIGSMAQNLGVHQMKRCLNLGKGRHVKPE